jgi:hypothetical protein
LQVPEIKGEKVELTEDKLSFTGSANGKNYHVDLEFYAPVTVEGSKWAVHGKEMQFVIMKKEVVKEHWPRLLKNSGKYNWLKADWSKWVDEDEEDAKPDFDGLDFGGMGGFPGMGGMGGQFGGMPGMPGMPGMGGMDFGGMGGMGDMGDMGDDEDDDDMPPMEDDEGEKAEGEQKPETI